MIILNSNDLFTVVISKVEANYEDNSLIIFQGEVSGFLMTSSSPNFILKTVTYWDSVQQTVYDMCIGYLKSITSNFRIKQVK